MKFSILIAHYNNFEYFKDCHQSILRQTYPNFEVVILDDCSTNGDFEKIKDFVKNDNRFRVFQNEKNMGVGYTKGKLIDLAYGEICGFLDPDDALIETALEESIKPYQQKNIVATYSQMYFCDDKMSILHIPNFTQKIRNGNKLFFNIFFEINHFFTFKKETYQKIEPILSHITIAEDQDLYLKIYEQGNIFYIKKPLYLYRRHSNGLSQVVDEQKKIIQKKYWNEVIKNALKRRKISELYGEKIEEIKDLSTFIYQKQNTIWKRILRKLK